eukprot:1526965-Prymnesium_polylepis.1
MCRRAATAACVHARGGRRRGRDHFSGRSLPGPVHAAQQRAAARAQDVRFLVEAFLRPLGGMISAELVRSIFANAEQILELHTGLDKELQASPLPPP